MSSGPAALAGISAQAGAIEAGRPANLLFFYPDAQSVLTKDVLYYRHPVSPYLGELLKGGVVATMLRGSFAFRDGDLERLPRGRELRLDG